ncbi:MAG: response regulator receiver protein, partial [Clostridiales bacterium]|nr:response regulator receiver protein [Clostridiales bacterium]
MYLHITTLGNFDIKIDEKSILEDFGRSYRILRLLHYFLTFKNKRLLPECIIDNLYGDSESFDPKNMLRAQIF